MDLLDPKYHKFDRYVNSWHIVIPRKRFGILRDSANVSGYRGCQFIIRIIGRNRAALFAGRVMRDWLGCVSIIDASARLLEWQNRRSVYGHPRVFRLAFEHASISLQIVLYNIACTRAKLLAIQLGRSRRRNRLSEFDWNYPKFVTVVIVISTSFPC